MSYSICTWIYKSTQFISWTLFQTRLFELFWMEGSQAVKVWEPLMLAELKSVVSDSLSAFKDTWDEFPRE
jgi:hypothetical protein